MITISRCSRFFFLFLVLNVVSALDFKLPEASDVISFGSFLIQTTPNRDSYGQVPRSSIELEMTQPEMRMPSSGAIFFVQREAPLGNATFSFPLGNAIAVEHQEKYVSVIAGISTYPSNSVLDVPQPSEGTVIRVIHGMILPGGEGSGVFRANSFSVGLYDVNNALWINPIFLAPWVIDHSAPTIRRVRLVKIGAADNMSMELAPSRGAKETPISCPQGNYALFIDAYDVIMPTSRLYAAPYRFALILDGKTILDSSFLGAKCSDNGLSFLGNEAPSENSVVYDGLYRIGSIVLPRGAHDLSVQVSDYAGNMSALKSHVLVY